MSDEDVIRVRRVQESDFLQVRDIALENHQESCFKEVEFSDEKFRKIFELIIERPDLHAGLIVEEGGYIRGYLYATLGEYFIGEKSLFVSVQSIYVIAGIRESLAGGKVTLGLVKAIKEWGALRHADYLMFHVTSGVQIKSTDRFFRRIGLKILGGNYLLSL
ncbi:hypothetical protein [Aliamphritea hakodatensis]|uniref:hypothetical protein n=1 Tax=Aliamphritea hakodatensis TaxID=2895352 RepID=UPI0022FD9AD7|nr:hypothetical protein [Aliamphritea hakodatensis]